MTYRFLFSLLILCFCNVQLALAEPFSAEHLVRLDRVGAPAVSPDGSQVVYTLRKTDMEAGKGRYDLWLSATDDGNVDLIGNTVIQMHAAQQYLFILVGISRHHFFVKSQKTST